MAVKSILDIGLDLASLAVDLSTKRDLRNLNFGGKPLGAVGKASAGIFTRLADELGIGHKDEAGFIVEVSKMPVEEEKLIILHLIEILDKKDLTKLRLVAYNAPEEEGVTVEEPGKKGEPPKKVTKDNSPGGAKFLSALAKVLKGKSDIEQRALMQKLNVLPETKGFTEAAAKRIAEVVKDELSIPPGIELSGGVIYDAIREGKLGVALKKLPGYTTSTPKPGVMKSIFRFFF